MAHLTEGTLRRMVDDPDARSGVDAAHLEGCTECQGRFQVVSDDARSIATLLAVPDARVDVGCAFDAQSGAVALSLPHETGKQGWLVTRLGDAAGLDQVSRFFHRGPATGVDQQLFG